MSFFGFDTTLPRDRVSSNEKRGIFEAADPFAEVARAGTEAHYDHDDAIDFEDTYDGLGDQLDEEQDTFNDATFGNDQDSKPVGRDFDFFGKTAQVADAIGEEQVRYSLQHSKASDVLSGARREATGESKVLAAAGLKPKRTGYEKYQDPGYIPDLQAKSSVWGTSQKKESASLLSSQAKRMLSLEEVEAQLRGQNQSSVPAHPAPSLPIQQPPFTAPTPEGYSDFPQHYPQAELVKAAPPSHLMHTQSTSSEPYPLPAHALPNMPLHAHQNMNIPPQAMPHSLQRLPGPPRAEAPRHQPTLSGGFPMITDPQQLMHLTEEQRTAYLIEDAKRAKRNHKIFLLSKGNGLMTPQDKNFITRIQLQQLVAAAGNVADSDSEAALSEDFYYQVYSQIRGAPRQHPHQPLGHFAQTYLFQTGNRVGGGHRRQLQNADNHMQRMQQQVQRAVEAAKLKPKSKQLIVEGSLGKISFSNAKTPKQMLNIKRSDSLDGLRAPKKPHTDLSLTDRKSVLGNIEHVYDTLMKMEDLERTMPSAPDESDPQTIQRHMEWRQNISSLNQRLWAELKVMEPIIPNATAPHPFIALLSYPKGKKAIPRIFRHIDQEQRVTILTMIIVHLDTLDVVRYALSGPGQGVPPVAAREAIDLFSQSVMPSLLGYVNEAPFNIIIGLLGLVITQTHVQTISRTRTGLGILTMLLSRAEIVKEAEQATEQDWKQWVDKFNTLFDTLETMFADIFPGPINVGDDMYVWQFLAAVGIGANPDQQQRLVIAVKDRVMETVSYSKTLPADMASQRLGNVNLFMRAIGLDVELLD